MAKSLEKVRDWDGVVSNCTTGFHGTVLRMQSLLLLGIKKLHEKLGQNSSLKLSHSAIRHNTDPVSRNLNDCASTTNVEPAVSITAKLANELKLYSTHA